MKSICSLILLTACVGTSLAQVLPNAKPVPRMQVLPLPGDEVSFTRDGIELTRYHYGPKHNRTFLYPIVGPSGRSLTRMGHPRDPVGHSHHNSVWVSHMDVNGVDFWLDTKSGRIQHDRILKLLDRDDLAAVQTQCRWVDTASETKLLDEKRTITLVPMQDANYLLVIDLMFQAVAQDVTFGDTAFGPIGVRMAKTIGVRDGGGTIRNSEGQVDEKEVFRKPAKWVDYSGPITPDAIEGITLMAHPDNSPFPPAFHVRNDGWMGSAMSFEKPVELKQGDQLGLRYGLYIHAGLASTDELNAAYEQFTKLPRLLAAEEK